MKVRGFESGTYNVSAVYELQYVISKLGTSKFIVDDLTLNIIKKTTDFKTWSTAKTLTPPTNTQIRNYTTRTFDEGGGSYKTYFAVFVNDQQPPIENFLGTVVTTDGINFTEHYAETGEDGFGISYNMLMLDVFYCNSNWYIMIFDQDLYKISFYNASDFSLVSEFNIEGVVAGYIEGTHYYFAGVIDGETITKIFDLDCSIVGSETITTEETLIQYNCYDYYVGVLIKYNDALFLTAANGVNYFFIEKKNNIWYIMESANYGLIYFSFKDDYTYTPYFYSTYKNIGGGLNTITIHQINWNGMMSKVDEITSSGLDAFIYYDIYCYGGRIGIRNNTDYSQGSLTQSNHLTSKTLKFQSLVALTKGMGIIVYTNTSTLCFIGKVYDLDEIKAWGTNRIYKITCTDLAQEDLNKKITADMDYRDAAATDPSNVLTDLLSTYCSFLYAGTIDDQSLTIEMYWAKGTQVALIIDDLEELAAKLIHFDPDGKTHMDDGDQDPTVGAITLTDANNIPGKSKELGRNETEIDVRGGIDINGNQVQGTYAKLLETDLSLSPTNFEISGLVDTDQPTVNAVAERLYDMLDQPIRGYKTQMLVVGCPEPGKKVSYSSASQGESARDIIIDQILSYNIDKNICLVLAYDYKFLGSD